MSIIEAILAGSEQVKGRASTTNGSSVALPHMRFSVILLKSDTEYLHKNFNESTTVCSLACSLLIKSIVDSILKY